MQYVGQTKRALKTRFKEHLFKIKKAKKKKKKKKKKKLIRFFINISGELVIHDHLVKFWFNPLKKYTQFQFYRKIQKCFKT